MDVVLASYEAFAADAAELKAFTWEVVVLDERHKAKASLAKAHAALTDMAARWVGGRAGGAVAGRLVGGRAVCGLPAWPGLGVRAAGSCRLRAALQPWGRKARTRVRRMRMRRREGEPSLPRLYPPTHLVRPAPPCAPAPLRPAGTACC